MKFKVKHKCPYCGFQFEEFKKIQTINPMSIEYCDPEEGGCDSKFASEVIIDVLSQSLKIQGEGS